MPPMPSIIQLTAPNPGPFTGEGTNTYLVGDRTLAVIDPGPDDPNHLSAILAAASGRPITHILLTHAHLDHVGGMEALQSATGALTVAFARNKSQRAANRLTPSGYEFVDDTVRPDIVLTDGVQFTAGDTTFEGVHTPGHAPDHMCFAVEQLPHVLFSGDHVMGWSTSVIAPPEGHMGDYLASLERLLTRPQTHFLPGHGPAILDGPRTARVYLLHRQSRERAILEAIRQGAADIPTITAIVYAGIAETLRRAASLSVQSHLELLAEKQLISASAPFAIAIGHVAQRPT